MKVIINLAKFFVVLFILTGCSKDSPTSSEQSEGEAYLETNGKREGVITTSSGLQYEILIQGDGAKPTISSTVVVHYRGTKIDGTEFDSSYGGAPPTFSVSGVIAGWPEALLLMNVGSKYRLVIPPSLAYGKQGAGTSIGPNEVLIFEIELLGIQ